MAALDIENLINHPHASVRLALQGGSRTWRSWLSGDFDMGTAATYSSPFEDMLEGLTENLGKVDVLSEGKLSEATDSFFETARIPKNLTHTWVSSERPTFDVTMAFVTLGESQPNPQEEVTSLAALALPGIGGGGRGTAGATFTRPAGYRPEQNASPPGTFTLKIGEWFEAKGLVLTAVQITLSQQRVILNGGTRPLYAEAQVSLEPFRMISADEFQEYFRG